MMINLPKECIVDKFIPKKTFYERVNISNSIKQEFIDKLEKIIWKYKLCEENINISKTDKVEEIEIFEIILKEKYNCNNIIKVITKNIPYPILFKILYNSEFKYAIKYNDEIYMSEWNENIDFNFNGINLYIIYKNIVKSISNVSQDTSNIDFELEKKKQIEILKQEILKLENKVKNEKQFNIRVEYNQTLNNYKKMLEELETNG